MKQKELTIKQKNFVELAFREKEWLATVETTKISADEFYISHRTSCLGEQSYRDYILKKIEYIQEYTNENNCYSALCSILLGKKKDYEVPIEFTRFLIKSIEERFIKAGEMIR